MWALYSPADLSRPAEIAAMVALAEQNFGAVDILINNARIEFVSPVEEFPIEKWDQIIAIKLSAAFHGIRAVAPGIALQVGLGFGQVRHLRPDQDRGA